MQTRDVAYYGIIPDLGSWSAMLALSLVVAYLGHAIFVRTRRGFADVI